MPHAIMYFWMNVRTKENLRKAKYSKYSCSPFTKDRKTGWWCFVGDKERAKKYAQWAKNNGFNDVLFITDAQFGNRKPKNGILIVDNGPLYKKIYATQKQVKLGVNYFD